ncbi:ABC transporter substrate-binding protein [Zhihengliuella halotolerans]|uniref:Carbohydrate ABC transporter substrate-binding protein (CUT1 family) n=1 Tax=Zhihengliuella halotolerans TaxID=370736 RepID=A0A4Q8AF14_9MICC|nr:extracellular solute-binding protein [Zhihengliuella halotolerans]RZU62887.1 carbohydrate ABC transporter substrate-binding protein (CUT1 family) [Zhihengliuella halotolerans]
MANSQQKRAGAAVVLATALALTACGGETEAGGDPQDPESFSGQTLTYWSFYQEQEPQAQAIAGAIDEFEAATGATVDVEWQGRQMTQKLAPALRSNAPDVVEAPLDNLAPLLGDGQAEDLAGVFEMASINEEAPLTDAGLDKYMDLVKTGDGTTFMVPYSVLGFGLWYDAKTHPDLADNAPQNLDDLAALVADAGDGALALDADVGFYTMLWVESVLMRELGPERLREVIEDETGEAWDDDDVLAATERVGEVFPTEAFAEGTFGSKFPAVQEGWATGGADFLLNGSWIPQETQNTAGEDFEFASLEIPEGAFGEANAQIGLTGYSVPKSADNKELAKAFIRFVLEQPHQEAYATEGRAMSTRTDVTVPDELAGIEASIAAAEPVLLLDGVNVDYSGIVDEVMAAPMRDLLSGKVDAEGFAAAIGAAQANYWKAQG